MFLKNLSQMQKKIKNIWNKISRLNCTCLGLTTTQTIIYFFLSIDYKKLSNYKQLQMYLCPQIAKLSLIGSIESQLWRWIRLLNFVFALKAKKLKISILFTMALTLVGPWSCVHPVGRSVIDSSNRREQTCPSPGEGRALPQVMNGMFCKRCVVGMISKH